MLPRLDLVVLAAIINLMALERRAAMNRIRTYVPAVARVFLGLVFTVFGLNFFLHFLPMPAAPPRAAAFAGALFASGYLFPLLKATEVTAGLLLLSNRFVPLALTLLAPVIVNILGFHLFLERGGFGIPMALLVAEVYLAWRHRAAFAPMLRARAPLPARADVHARETLHAAA
jgi:uncharacterized membrane protein YphA (DoxX/SURF4 family)